MIRSYNQQIICEPYTGKTGIKAKISSGVAVVQQKTGVIGLKVLADAEIKNGKVMKGDTVYIKESILHVNKTYSLLLECEDIGKPFCLINFGEKWIDIISVDHPEWCQIWQSLVKSSPS